MQKEKKQVSLNSQKKFLKKNPPKITLKKILHKIYNAINLETTCKGRCECCKVAMPQINYCEFMNILHEINKNTSKSFQLELICKSIKYFFAFQFEKYGMQTLMKPCMLLDEGGKCMFYEIRPLNCRLYGLWPTDLYEKRVQKFEKVYDGLLKREEIPLNTQCPYVKRIDESQPITEDVINGLFIQLDKVDYSTKKFSEVQIENSENYRTFHDWLLLWVFGEEWLSNMTDFMIDEKASKEVIDDLVLKIIQAVKNKFSIEMPNLKPNI